MNHGGIRILEVGEFALLKRALPRETVLLNAATRRAQSACLADFFAASIPDLARVRKAIRAGMFDLIAVHATGGSEIWVPARSALVRWVLGEVGRLGGAAPAVIGLDLHDAFTIHPSNFSLLKACRLYFKRELPLDYGWLFRPWRASRQMRLEASAPGTLGRLRPIPLGIGAAKMEMIPDAAQPKDADVFFAGDLRASFIRRGGFAELKSLAAEGIRVDLPEARLSQKEFFERCARAWLTWSPAGTGWQCFRHAEAALCRSVPVINDSPIREHAPLMHGQHCLYYPPEPGGLTRAVLDSLRDKERLARMAEAARHHILSHHTHPAVCAYIMAACRG